MPIEDFEAAIEEIERKLGLLAQPRVVVFHEKKGRRHCHAVWLRLKASDFNPRRMVGVQMSHFKYKLMDISRALFRKYGWAMPKGMERKQDKNPNNLSREEYRQASKLGEDPQALKMFFKQSWERTDSKQTFARFLSENGFFLAQGDRRGYVAVDLAGKVYSLSKWMDIPTRDLKARLGSHELLPTTDKARAFIAERMTENLKRHMEEIKAEAKAKRLPLVQEIRLITAQHRKARVELVNAQEKRHKAETKVRIARFATGVAALWERATGEYQKKCALNAAEIKSCRERDRKELHALVRSQLIERQGLEKTIRFYREEQRQDTARIRREIADYISTATVPKAALPSPAAAAGGAILLPAHLAQELREARGQDFTRLVEKLPLVAQLAQVETKIALLSGDLSLLQASLESNLLSDEMRGRIRRLIEKTLETLHLKAIEEKTVEQKAQEKTREYQVKQAEFNEYVRRYAELQIRVEEEQRRQEANRSFYAVIQNMSYALNGLPAWKVSVMPPPEDRRLDEREYVQKVVLQRDNPGRSATRRRRASCCQGSFFADRKVGSPFLLLPGVIS
ncbi:MAG: hypothetical protein JNM12_15170 [Alphaproteobacteria bacterium]|nr:hypothetical protein [Alphaproteobacteria bacterium]